MLNPEEKELTTAPLASTGLVGSGPVWLDTQFAACEPEYEAMLRSVGIQNGWHVLDAGCGSGAYLPALASLVGSNGSIDALDLAPENIAAVHDRIRSWSAKFPIVVRLGSVLALDYAEAQFDAVWCSNTLQYLDRDALRNAFGELRRVVRPGGLIAIKEAEPSLAWLEPTAPYLLQRRLQARLASERWDPLRGRTLRRAFAEAALADPRIYSTLVERWAPLRPVEQKYYRERLAYLAQTALEVDVSETDRTVWRGLLDPHATGHLAESADFYMREGHVLAVGRVPD
jgi:ubiquinone/menaquinone biosynthesis C-methylase UbiE